MTPERGQELMARLEVARKAFHSDDRDTAWSIADEILLENPDHVPALILATMLLDKARLFSKAYQFARRAVDFAPQMSATWLNYGKLCEEMYLLTLAEEAYNKAISLSKNKESSLLSLNNMASFYCTVGEWKWAEETALKALEIEPTHRKAHGNLGIAQLAQRKWTEAWINYGHMLGSEQRKFNQYSHEPEWDGTPRQKVIVYGEQGIGDEISFASMLPDAIRDCASVVVDCNERLETLFRRSFPGAKIYGTRHEAAIQWDVEDTQPDASISIGQLGRIYRLRDSDFPGTPYLVPDPEKLSMWLSYFGTKHKPVIGIAWTGGITTTGQRYRQWKLPDMQPLFDAVDAHWVSLQYDDRGDDPASFTGAKIHDYRFATRSKDYDDTAALVAACDLVICMQTSVAHLAAALGIEAWVFVTKLSQWRYAGEGDTIPWYRCLKVYRQGADGVWPFADAARVLKLRYGAGVPLKVANAVH